MSAPDGLREYDTPRGSPDGSQSIVGKQGLPLAQDGEELVIQQNLTTQSTDFDIESESITDSEDVVLASPNNVGGTTELSGALKSDEEQPFTTEILWLASDGSTELYRETLVTADDEVVLESVTTKSDFADVIVTDESDTGVSNQITGTLNFH